MHNIGSQPIVKHINLHISTTQPIRNFNITKDEDITEHKSTRLHINTTM